MCTKLVKGSKCWYSADWNALCKKWISSHLLINKWGRHLNIRHSLPRNEDTATKICCSNAFENEKHFLLKCKSFDDQRVTLNKKILNIHKQCNRK